MEPQVQFQVTLCEYHGGQSGTSWGSSLNTSVFSYHSPFHHCAIPTHNSGIIWTRQHIVTFLVLLGCFICLTRHLA